MLRSIFPLALIAAFFLFSCKKKSKAEDFSQAKTAYDVSYGSDPKQSFNLFLPANRSSATTKTLILIHGGAWLAGDKSDWNGSISTLQSMFPGYAFIAIGYRLYVNGQNMFPTQENDVRNAINYIMAHREDYGISDQFGIFGVSAGSHLGLLYSYKYGTSDYMPKAMVDMVGPTDMLKMYDTGSSYDQLVLWGLIGNRYDSDSMKYIASSPVRYASVVSPPTLILQGDADTLVPWQQAQSLHNKLDQLGVTNQYTLYAGEGHGLTGVTADALSRMQAFLNTHL